MPTRRHKKADGSRPNKRRQKDNVLETHLGRLKERFGDHQSLRAKGGGFAQRHLEVEGRRGRAVSVAPAAAGLYPGVRSASLSDERLHKAERHLSPKRRRSKGEHRRAPRAEAPRHVEPAAPVKAGTPKRKQKEERRQRHERRRREAETQGEGEEIVAPAPEAAPPPPPLEQRRPYCSALQLMKAREWERMNPKTPAFGPRLGGLARPLRTTEQDSTSSSGWDEVRSHLRAMTGAFPPVAEHRAEDGVTVLRSALQRINAAADKLRPNWIRENHPRPAVETPLARSDVSFDESVVLTGPSREQRDRFSEAYRPAQGISDDEDVIMAGGGASVLTSPAGSSSLFSASFFASPAGAGNSQAMPSSAVEAIAIANSYMARHGSSCDSEAPAPDSQELDDIINTHDSYRY